MIPPSDGWDQAVQAFELALADACVLAAQAALLGLIAALGKATEPDFATLVPAYDRMLAIGSFLLVVFASLALVEEQIGGRLGAGFNLIPRVLVACFAALTGLTLLALLESHAALLATVWTSDYLSQSHRLEETITTVYSPTGAAPPMGSLLGLIATALITLLLALFVYVELVLRAALLLVTAAFIPLVAAMWVWPRMTTAASHMAGFVVGLLLSKFVIATAVYIGFSLIVGGLSQDPGSNAMIVGLAVLLVAALSPIALFQGLHFGQQAAAPLSRGWVSGGGQALFGGASRLARGPAGLIGKQVKGMAAGMLGPAKASDAVEKEAV